MSIQYLLDKEGGFTVLDDSAKISAYAYPTSDTAKAAARSEYRAREIACRMITHARGTAPFCYPHIVAEQYQRSAAHVAAQRAAH